MDGLLLGFTTLMGNKEVLRVFAVWRGICMCHFYHCLFGRLENISEVHSKMKSLQSDIKICSETLCVELLQMASLVRPEVPQPEVGVEIASCNTWINMLPKTSNSDGFLQMFIAPSTVRVGSSTSYYRFFALGMIESGLWASGALYRAERTWQEQREDGSLRHQVAKRKERWMQLSWKSPFLPSTCWVWDL